MKKATAIIVSVLFVLSLAGVAFAAKKAPAKKVKILAVTGEVLAVDAKAMTLTVKGKKGEVAVTTDEKTKFAKGKSLAEVKVGDKATVKYVEEDGKNIAKSVMFRAIPAKKVKKVIKKEMKKEAPAKPAAAPAPAPAQKKTGGY